MDAMVLSSLQRDTIAGPLSVALGGSARRFLLDSGRHWNRQSPRQWRARCARCRIARPSEMDYRQRRIAPLCIAPGLERIAKAAIVHSSTGDCCFDLDINRVGPLWV